VGPNLLLFWQNRCVSYSLQTDASSQMPLTLVRAIAQQAFSAWSDVPCGDAGGAATITAVEMEPIGALGVDCDEVQFNPYGPNQHVIVFRDEAWPHDDSANTLGFTTVTYDVGTGEIRDADMEINSHDFVLVPTPPAPAGTVDLLTIMTHEAGHFLGLGHSGDLTAMMYASYHAGAWLTQDDVDGLCSIYFPDGTRSTSAGAVPNGACDPTPARGLTSECAPEELDGAVIPPPEDAASDVSNAPVTSSAPALDTAAPGCATVGARATPRGVVAGAGILALGCLARGAGRGRRQRRRDRSYSA
jgi:hypothetical protein